MTAKMIDRLATAFSEEGCAAEWEHAVALAHLALEAIREPSEQMSEAGAEIIRNVGPEESPEAHKSDASNTWRMMIDAALSE